MDQNFKIDDLVARLSVYAVVDGKPLWLTESTFLNLQEWNYRY